MEQSYEVITIAGNGLQGFKDGDAQNATFANPIGICASNDGRLYITNYHKHCVRMLYDDQVITIAGNGERGFKDGNALEAMFWNPMGICISNDGILYVSDHNNHRVRTIHNNEVTTIAGNGKKGFKDGNALEAILSQPASICISNDGKLYITDNSNHKIRMIYNNQVTTIAGSGGIGFKDGPALEAMFWYPVGICISNSGKLYVSDYMNHRVRMIDNGQVTTIAGKGQEGFKDGNAEDSMFWYPAAVCISSDDRLYVSDHLNQRIRMIQNGKVSTIAGNGQQGFKDGDAEESKFADPYGMCLSKDGRLYVCDHNNHRIRMITCTYLQKSPFGFALLLDMRDNILCDSQMSFNNIIYHLHSTLVNVRCPSLFDKSYYSLILQSNISNKSFESFLTFLYSNKLTKEQNEIWPANMTIKNIVELIFVFDVMMNCKWILEELNRRFRKQLIEILNKNEQECVKELIVDVLPYVYSLQEISKTKPAYTTTIIVSYTEYCYNMFVHELKKKRSIITKHLEDLENNTAIAREAYLKIAETLASPTSRPKAPLDDEPMIVFGSELVDLSELAFAKTNIGNIDKKNDNTETPVPSSISTQHLDKWTTPDFVIKSSNDDIEYHVHKLILCGRWKYFCQMIESGLKEANDNEMTLSDDWTKSRFEKMMKYIYLNEIEFESVEDNEWLMENGKLYGITVDMKSENEQHEGNNNTQSGQNETSN